MSPLRSTFSMAWTFEVRSRWVKAGNLAVCISSNNSLAVLWTADGSTLSSRFLPLFEDSWVPRYLYEFDEEHVLVDCGRSNTVLLVVNIRNGSVVQQLEDDRKLYGFSFFRPLLWCHGFFAGRKEPYQVIWNVLTGEKIAEIQSGGHLVTLLPEKDRAYMHHNGGLFQFVLSTKELIRISASSANLLHPLSCGLFLEMAQGTANFLRLDDGIREQWSWNVPSGHSVFQYSVYSDLVFVFIRERRRSAPLCLTILNAVTMQASPLFSDIPEPAVITLPVVHYVDFRLFRIGGGKVYMLEWL